MYVDLWAWFQNCEQEAIQRGDAKRQRLVSLARDGWRYRNVADSERAIQAFEEGVAIAETLNEGCWRIFHHYWAIEMKYSLRNDYQSTLDEIVRLVAETRKDQYADCPVRSRVFFVLASIYYLLDFYGYEQEIQDLFDYMEKEVVMDEDTHLRLLYKRADMDFDHERYELAEEKTKDIIHRAPSNDFRLCSCYDMLRRIAFARGDIHLALGYNRLAQKYAGIIQIQRSISSAKICETLYFKRLGEDRAAQEQYFAALAHHEQFKLPRELTYYDFLAEYAELCGNQEEALNYRQTLLPIIMAKPSLYTQMIAYRHYLQLLGKMGRDFSEPLETAKALAMTSRKPQAYLDRLERIEKGNFYDYDWQKP